MSRRTIDPRSENVVGTRDPGLLAGAGDLDAARSRRVPRNAFVQRFRDLLAVAVAAELLLVGGTADERDFRQNSGHGAFGEDDESGFFNATIAQAGVLHGECAVERALDAGRQPPRLLNTLLAARRRKRRRTGRFGCAGAGMS